jgi:simple sugar transport system substrate-binding protein
MNKGSSGTTVSLNFVFISTCIEEDFFKPVRRGMDDAATMLGVECRFIGTPEVDIPAQVEMVRAAIADGMDGIALNIIDPEAFDDVIEQALDAGIPVIAFNVDDDKTPNRRLSAVCQNLYEAGRILGKEAQAFIPDNSKILMTVHSEGISALEDRLSGAQAVLQEKEITWKVVTTGIEAGKAAEIIAVELKADHKIRTILCTGQADTEGAGLAVERHFSGKGYHVAGFDLSPGILRLVKDGVIDFTIDQQPYVQGFYPVVQLTHYCRFGLLPSNIDTGACLITAENVEAVIALVGEGVR